MTTLKLTFPHEGTAARRQCVEAIAELTDRSTASMYRVLKAAASPTITIALADVAATMTHTEAEAVLARFLLNDGQQDAAQACEFLNAIQNRPTTPEPTPAPRKVEQTASPVSAAIAAIPAPVQTAAGDAIADAIRLIAAGCVPVAPAAPAIDRSEIESIVAASVAFATLPITHRVEYVQPAAPVEPPAGLHHKQVADLLTLVSHRAQNILMIGPAGSGKTTLAKSLANHLGLEFGYQSLSEGTSEAHILGRVLPTDTGAWQYQTSAFVRAYTKPGVWLWDEFDAATPNVLLCINAATANGHLSNPVDGKIYERHPQFYIICAANTYGTGATAMYSGRNQLDNATLDRFGGGSHRVWVDYDTTLETSLMIAAGLTADQREQVTGWLYPIRRKVAENRINRMAGSRTLKAAADWLATGGTLAEVQSKYTMGWTEAELQKVGLK